MWFNRSSSNNSEKSVCSCAFRLSHTKSGPMGNTYQRRWISKRVLTVRKAYRNSVLSPPPPVHLSIPVARFLHLLPPSPEVANMEDAGDWLLSLPWPLHLSVPYPYLSHTLYPSHGPYHSHDPYLYHDPEKYSG